MVESAVVPSDAGPVPVQIIVVHVDTLTTPLAASRLSVVERARVQRFRHSQDRQVHATAALLVRAIAGRALGVAPGLATITRRCPGCGGPHGAPYVDGAPLLSVSHCDGLAVVASCALPVGVDAEPADRDGLLAITGMLLHPDEEVHDPADLLRTWVRKEAVSKATGVGLTVPLTEIRVTAPHEPPAVLRYGPRPELAIALADVPVSGAIVSVAVQTDRPLDVQVMDGADLVTER